MFYQIGGNNQNCLQFRIIGFTDTNIKGITDVTGNTLPHPLIMKIVKISKKQAGAELGQAQLPTGIWSKCY